MAGETGESAETAPRTRVVVTGMGVVSALGNNLAEFTNALRNDRSGTALVTRFETDWFTSRVGAEVQGYDFDRLMSPGEQKHHDRNTLLALAAADEAMRRAGLLHGPPDPRGGVIVGTGMGPMQSWADGFTEVRLNHKKPRPTVIPRSMYNAACGQIAIRHGLQGPSQTIVTACASSAHALAAGLDLLRAGRADRMLVGGVEVLPSYETWAAWDTLRVMSRDNDRPEAACRPFSADRTGFVMGEAAAMLVLEPEEAALDRGAMIYGELAGAGMSTDASHITAPAVPGLVQAMTEALDDARLTPDQMQYVNAHGTGTPLNDPAEVAALKIVFGDHAPKLAVSSTKSATGHCIGAAGALEAVATVSALDLGFIPATLHLDEPDPECDLNHVPNHHLDYPIKVAMSNSFAFGGHNVALVFRKYGD